jgi:hypothetical protein
VDEQTVARALDAQAERNRTRRAAARARHLQADQQAQARQQEQAAEWQADPQTALARAVAETLAGRDGAVRTLRGESDRSRTHDGVPAEDIRYFRRLFEEINRPDTKEAS